MKLWHLTFASGFVCGAIFVALLLGLLYLFVTWRARRRSVERSLRWGSTVELPVATGEYLRAGEVVGINERGEAIPATARRRQ